MLNGKTLNSFLLLPCWGISSLYLNLYGDGKATPVTEGLLRDFQNWSSLLALVFTALYQLNNPANQVQADVMSGGNRLRRLIAFDVSLENRIEHIIGRQRVRVLLLWTQLRRRLLFNDGARYPFARSIDVVAELVDL